MSSTLSSTKTKQNWTTNWKIHIRELNEKIHVIWLESDLVPFGHLPTTDSKKCEMCMNYCSPFTSQTGLIYTCEHRTVYSIDPCNLTSLKTFHKHCSNAFALFNNFNNTNSPIMLTLARYPVLTHKYHPGITIYMSIDINQYRARVGHYYQTAICHPIQPMFLKCYVLPWFLLKVVKFCHSWYLSLPAV